MKGSVVNRVFAALMLIAFAAGCATTNKIEKRKQEKYSAYAALSPEMRELVDKGQIAVGMPMDAVHIAWGKPSQGYTGQSEKSTTTTWVYFGTAWQEYRYWNYHYYPYRYGYYASPHLDYDYTPRSYTAAEVTFENGVVKTWRNLTAPPPY